jgi:hypothetical protein
VSVDWTTIIVGGLTGLGGYMTAKLNSKTAIDQAKETSKVAVEHAQSGERQIGLSEAIADRRRREDAYVELVDDLALFEAAGGQVGVSTPQINGWRDRFDHRVNVVRILGASEVPALTETCSKLVHRILDDNLGTQAGFAQHGDALLTARIDLLSEMRKDTQPRKQQ